MKSGLFPRTGFRWFGYMLVMTMLVVSTARAYVFSTSAPKWPNGTITMHMEFGPSPTLTDGGTWNSNAIAAMQEWNANMANVQFAWVAETSTAGTSKNSRNEMFFAADAYGQAWDATTLAITITWYTSSARVESDVIVNSTVGFDAYRGPLRAGSGGHYVPEFRRVILHELGHSLGFDHTDAQSTPSIMFSHIGDLEHLSDDDKAGVALYYGAVGSTPPSAPVITNQPASVTANTGDTVTFTVAVTSATAVTYQWSRNNVTIPGATSATLTLNSVTSANAGNYTVVATNSTGSVTSATATLTVNAPPSGGSSSSKLVNISTRATVGTGGDVMIAGFIIKGTGPKSVLIRASGPALSKFGVSGVLADPTLELHNASSTIGTNDNWGDDGTQKTALTNAFKSTGFSFDDGSKDAAILTSLNPGSYTVVVGGKNNTTGVSLIEAYEMDVSNNNAKLINISTRSLVKTDAEVQIAGFVISGTSAKRVLIRASGPALTQYGVTGVLSDPVLNVYSGSTVIATNDDWDSALRTEFAKNGIDNWAVGSKDAATVLTLNPGAYTAIVSGKNNATGVVLIEVFEDD